MVELNGSVVGEGRTLDGAAAAVTAAGESDDWLVLGGLTAILASGSLGNVVGLTTILVDNCINREPFAGYMFGVMMMDTLVLVGFFVFGILFLSINNGTFLFWKYCKFYSYATHVGMSGSGFIMVVSSVERCLLLWFPTKISPSSRRRVLLLVVGCFVASCLSSTPNLAKYDAYPTAEGGYECYMSIEEYPPWVRSLGAVQEVGFSWLLVSLALVPLNAAIVLKMRLRHDRKASNGSSKREHHAEIGRALVLASLFQITLPIPRVVNAMLLMLWDIRLPPLWHVISFLTLPSVNHAVNFYIFVATWTKFRTAVVALFRCNDRNPPAQ